jgi:hypothetical protein
MNIHSLCPIKITESASKLIEKKMVAEQRNGGEHRLIFVV